MSTLRLISVFAVFVFICSLSGIILLPAAVADTQYVSDLMIISMKEGQDPDTPVVGYLRSAAAVEVLEETGELMRIQIEDGSQGWVRKKFIVKDKPKAVLIKELEEKIALLEDDIKTLQKGSDTQDLTNTIKEYKQRIVLLTTSLENEKKTKLTLQDNLQEVNAAYQALVNTHKNTADTIKELASVKDENRTLKDKIAALPPMDATPMLPGNMKWFLIGGGVLLLGFIMGRAIRGGRRTHRY